MPDNRQLLRVDWLGGVNLSGGGTWQRSGGLERVYSLALFLWHIGPPVVVTAVHVKLRFWRYLSQV
jgi:hypothetical protein